MESIENTEVKPIVSDVELDQYMKRRRINTLRRVIVFIDAIIPVLFYFMSAVAVAYFACVCICFANGLDIPDLDANQITSIYILISLYVMAATYAAARGVLDKMGVMRIM